MHVWCKGMHLSAGLWVGRTGRSRKALAQCIAGLFLLALGSAASAADTRVPSIPGGFTATRVATNQIDLRWTASTDNVAVREYRIERCKGTACTNYLQIATTTGTSFSNRDSALITTTSFRYRVRAMDTSGNLGGYSARVTVSGTVARDTQWPTPPAGLAATRASSSQINLSWRAASDNVGIREYRVERCQGAGCTGFAQIASTTGTTFSNQDSALTTAASYSYRVRAVDTSGNFSGYSATATVPASSGGDTQAPTTPAGFRATRASASQINLSWAAATDNVGLREYRVERCQGAGCTAFTQVASTAGTALANWDPALVTTASFSYRVRAVDTSGNLSGYSATATVPASSGGDTQAPTTPAGLRANRVSASEIDLSWSAATDNVGLREYRVERCQGAGCTAFTQVASTAGTALANWDPALLTTVSFSYRVRAVDTSGNLSGISATATVPASGATTPTVNRPPVISGSPATTVVAGNAYAFTPAASDPDGQTLTFRISGAPSWTTFSTATGALRGTPGGANVGRTDGIVITASDGTNSVSLPAFSLSVVQAASGTATVSWQPPSQRTDGSALTNLAGYEIRYGTSATLLDRTIQVNNAGLTRYVVEGLASGTWYFGVIAFDSARVGSDLSAVRSKTIP